MTVVGYSMSRSLPERTIVIKNMKKKSGTIIMKCLVNIMPYMSINAAECNASNESWVRLIIVKMDIPTPSMWPSGIGSHFGQNRLRVRFLAVSDIYPMFIEPTITWVIFGELTYNLMNSCQLIPTHCMTNIKLKRIEQMNGSRMKDME